MRVSGKIVKAPIEAERSEAERSGPKQPSRWYLRVELEESDAFKVFDFEDKYKRSKAPTSFQHSIHNRVVVVKLPFRYNKFECTVYDTDGDFVSCYELKDGDNVELELTHAGFNAQIDGNVLSSWKTTMIRVKV